MSTVNSLATARAIVEEMGGRVHSVYKYVSVCDQTLYKVCYTDRDEFELEFHSPDVRRETIAQIYVYGKWRTKIKYRLFLDVEEDRVGMTPYTLRSGSFSHMLHDGGTSRYWPLYIEPCPMDKTVADAQIQRFGEIQWELRVRGDKLAIFPVYMEDGKWCEMPVYGRIPEGFYATDLIERFPTYTSANEARQVLVA